MENWVLFEDDDREEKGETSPPSSLLSSSLSISSFSDTSPVVKTSEELEFFRDSTSTTSDHPSRNQNTHSRRIRTFNNFYTQPSPKPHLLITRRSETGRRTSTAVPPPSIGIFPIGLIEMGRSQRKSKVEKKKKKETEEKSGVGFWRVGFGCKCSSTSNVVLDSITCCASSVD